MSVEQHGRPPQELSSVEVTTTRRQQRLYRVIRILAGVSISALLSYLMFRNIDWSQFLLYALALDPALTGGALLVLVMVYLIKLLRWHRMLRLAGSPISISICARPFFIGFALNNLLPLRAGDFARVLSFQETIALPRSTILITLMVERLLDLFVLICILGLALVMLPLGGDVSGWADKMAWTSGVVFLGLGFMLFGVLMPGRVPKPLMSLTRLLPGKAEGRLNAVLEQIRVAGRLLSSKRILLVTAIMTVLAWALEGCVFVLTAQALDQDSTGACLAMAAGNLGTLLPGAPGHIGTFDYFTMQGMIAYDVDKTQAVAFAVMVHLVLWLPVTLLGLGYLAIASIRGDRA